MLLGDSSSYFHNMKRCRFCGGKEGSSTDDSNITPLSLLLLGGAWAAKMALSTAS